MNTTQKVYHQREMVERVLYAFQVWITLSDAQQELIYNQMGW